MEPHTGLEIGLGTLPVRDYLSNRSDSAYITQSSPRYFSTRGPANRYGAILFVEKEGFFPLFRKERLSERYDLAVMSTKGMSTTAARHLVDNLCAKHDGVPLLIMRDFDKAGFSIASTLSRNTDRFAFQNEVNAIDLGLRLEDIQRYELESETVEYGKANPVRNLRLNGATGDEIDYLLEPNARDKVYSGRRVELNAFSSRKLMDWIEAKLAENGIAKLVPDDETLAKAYRQAFIVDQTNQARRRAAEQAAIDADSLTVPDGLRDRLTAMLADQPGRSWDDALMDVVRD